MNEIKERINALIANDEVLSLEELQTILSDIRINDNEVEKKELFDYLVKELLNEIKSWKLTEEEAQQNIDIVVEKMKFYGGLTEIEIEDLFKEHNFTLENILSEEEVIEEEIIQENHELSAKEEALEEENTLEDGVYQFEKNGKTGYVKKNGDEYISLSDDSELNLTKEEYEQILPQAQLLSSSNNNEVINNVINNVGKTNKNNESVVVEEPEAVIEKKEIEIIRERINELEQELTDTMTLEEIDNKIKELEKEKSQNIKEIESKTLKEWIASKENLENIVRKPGRMVSEDERKALQSFYTAVSKPSESKNIEDAINVIEKLPNGSEIKKALLDATEKLACHYNLDAISDSSEYKNNHKKLAKLKNEIDYILDNQRLLVLNKEYEELKVKVNGKYADGVSSTPEFREEQKKLDELKKEIENLREKITKNNPLLKLQKEYEELKIKVNGKYADGVNSTPEFREEQKKLDELKKELKYLEENLKDDNYLSKLKEEYEKINTKIEKQKPFEELKQSKKEIQSSYDKEIASLQNLKNKKLELEALKKIPPAYEKIKNDAIGNFESQILDDEALKNAIDEYINNRPEINELNNYPNADKLKKELKEEIFENLKVKKIEKKEQKSKTVYKVLAGIAGGLVGYGLSFTPVLGGAIVVGAQLAKTIARNEDKIKEKINAYTKKHENGIIAKIQNGINEISENHPKIKAAIGKIKAALKSDYAQWAINGMTIGYALGNLKKLVSNNNSIAQGNVTGDTGVVNESVIDSNVFPSTPPEIVINPGEVYDISGLEYGFSSSHSSNPVHLLTEIGKAVEVDKFNIVNGETMVHFKQLNGKGYAWFKLSEVEKLLSIAKGTGKIL